MFLFIFRKTNAEDDINRNIEHIYPIYAEK